MYTGNRFFPLVLIHNKGTLQSRTIKTWQDPPYKGHHTKTVSARHSLFIRFWILRRLLLNSGLSKERYMKHIRANTSCENRCALLSEERLSTFLSILPLVDKRQFPKVHKHRDYNHSLHRIVRSANWKDIVGF